MSLGMYDRFQAGVGSWATGDVDVLSKMFVSPESITVDEARPIAEKLGFKGGFLKFMTNIAFDPLMWGAMLLSRRFPTKQWMDGTVPHRFVGANNEFTGLSMALRPVESMFRGTGIARLNAVAAVRAMEVRKVGQDMLDLIRKRPNWQNHEKRIVTMMLEGQRVDGITPELTELTRQLRSGMEEMYGFLSQTKHVTGGFDQGGVQFARSEDLKGFRAPKHLRDYLPHIPVRGKVSQFEIDPRLALEKMGRGGTGQHIAANQLDHNMVWKDAGGRLESNWHEYQRFMRKVGNNVFNGRLRHRTGKDLKLMDPGMEEDFITDLDIILQRYTDSVARTYAVNAPLTNHERALATIRRERADGTIETLVPTAGTLMENVINQGIEASARKGKSLVRVEHLPNGGTREVIDTSSMNPVMLKGLQNQVRNLSGGRSEDKIITSGLMDNIRAQVQSSPLPEKLKLQAERGMTALENDGNPRNVADGIANYFYSTTLGLNVGSSIRNMIQPFVTTAPAIGFGSTMAGYRELRAGIPRMGKEFSRAMRELSQEAQFSGGKNTGRKILLAQQTAYEKAFPELAETGITFNPRAFETQAGVLAERVTRGESKYDDFQKFLMLPFTTAEVSNQVVSFYGGRHAVKKMHGQGFSEVPKNPDGTELAGPAYENWVNFEAGQIVHGTQFKPGPGSRSILQDALPAPLRMFSSFPTRLLNFMSESTVRGAALDSQLQTQGAMGKILGRRNWGTLARSYMWGRVVSEGARQAIGVDLESSVGLTGPLNLGSPYNIAGIFPTPPIAGVVASVGKAAYNGDASEMQQLNVPYLGEVPIPKALIPAGVAISQMGRAINQYSPDMAGMTDENGRLMNETSTMERVMGAFGLHPDKNRRSRQSAEIMRNNDGRIKELRRQMIHAMSMSNEEEVQSIQSTYASEFPDHFVMGGPLSVTNRDLNRHTQNQYKTQLGRALDQSSKLTREVYEPGFMVFDPDLLLND